MNATISVGRSRARGAAHLLPRLGRLRDRRRPGRRLQVDRRPRDRADDHDRHPRHRPAHRRGDEPGPRARAGARPEHLGRLLGLLRRAGGRGRRSPRSPTTGSTCARDRLPVVGTPESGLDEPRPGETAARLARSRRPSGRPRCVRLLALAAALAARLSLQPAVVASAPAAPGCPPTLDDGAGPFGRGAPPRRAKIGTGHVLTGIVLSSRRLPPARGRPDPPLAGEPAWGVRPLRQRDRRHRPRRPLPLRGATARLLRGPPAAHPPARGRGRARAALHPLRAEARREAGRSCGSSSSRSASRNRTGGAPRQPSPRLGKATARCRRSSRRRGRGRPRRRGARRCRTPARS